jgi:2-polyprenyl-3-methyl-5-hydroxy-6-metoxy-1,4-benzoquinol methylase
MTDEELTAAIREVQERARARVPRGPLGLDGVAAADLMPVVHARDAAEPKAAAIGTVNPRPPGVGNNLIQAVKRRIARMLDWYVREQIEFNRASMVCVQASLEAMTEMNRSIAALAAHHQQLQNQLADYHREAEELKDIRQHWSEWRTGFEERRSASEIHLLRTISELQGAFQHRVTLLEQNFRQLVAQTHTEFTQQLGQNTREVQERLWADLQKVRTEFEALIHAELRLLRRKPPVLSTRSELPEAAEASPVPIDWLRFAEIFRGSEERILEHQRRYIPRFANTTGEVLDLGCGRGEFLRAAREAGVPARGIDLSRESVEMCRAMGLSAEHADMFAYLNALADRELGGAFCSQVIEHLPPGQLPLLINVLAQKLRTGGVVVFETPNPECLAIFATHFLIDPTHTRPVPPALLRFYLQEAGFGGIETERLFPAVETMPALASLPSEFREAFFGSLDYAIIATKL